MNTEPKITRYLLYALSLTLLCFVAVKSHITSMTHDESLSFNVYAHYSFKDIVAFENPYPNNHVLNTLIMKCAAMLFGVSESVLRFHSLVGFMAYLFACFHISAELPKARIASFILMFANPYLVDFFGLARGYGLGIGCIVLAIWFILRWIKTERLVFIAGFNCCALLAAYSNMSLIMFYIAALFSVNLVWFIKKRATDNAFPRRFYWLRFNAVNLFFMICVALILWEPVRKTISLHHLDFGGKSDVVTDTIYSVVAFSFYHIEPPRLVTMAISWCVAATIVLLLVWWVSMLVKRKQPFPDRFYLFVFVNSTLVCILLGSIAQHYLLKNDYPIERFALFLYPLFILNLILWFQLATGKKRSQVTTVWAPSLLAVLFALNFLYNLNLSSYRDWEYDADTKKMIGVLMQYRREHGEQTSIRIGNKWYFEPAINFYRELYHLDWLQQADRRGPLKDDAYLYSDARELAELNLVAPKILFTSRLGAMLIDNK